MNIWQIMAMAEAGEEPPYQVLRDFNAVPEKRDHFLYLMETRQPGLWFTCDASGWVVPNCVLGTTVGWAYQNERVVYAEWVDRARASGGCAYRLAEDETGTLGYEHVDHAYETHNGRYITARNYRDNYYTCPDCSEVYPYDEYEYDEERDEHICVSCFDESERRGRGEHIHPYSTKVENVLDVSLKRGVRYFGLEVEQEFPGEHLHGCVEYACNEIDGLSQMSIWKEDGSLSHGAELVTVPKPLSYWQGDNPLRDLCNDRQHRRVARAHNTTTCGLHVHVSRNTIPEPVIAKIIYLMNEPCMLETLALVARRSMNSTFTRAQKKGYHSDQNHLKGQGPAWLIARPAMSINRRQYITSRYTPVNLTDKTIEFRIFKGTLKYETILASVEFCEAVISYCTQFGPGRMNDRDFCEWLKLGVTRKTYPALRDYLEARTVLPMRRHKRPEPAQTETPEPTPTIGQVVRMSEPNDPAEDVMEGRARWSSADMSFCDGFIVDDMHWWVSAETLVARGWLGAVPIRRYNEDESALSVTETVNLVAGSLWRSEDGATSLFVTA